MAPAPNGQAPGLLLVWLILNASMGFYLWLNGPSTISRILLAAGLLLLLYVVLRRPGPAGGLGYSAIDTGFAALLGIQLAIHSVIPFRPELPAPTILLHALALVSLIALGLWHAPRIRGVASARLGAWAIGLAVATALIARFAIIAFDVEPGFDVHLIQDAAGNALLAGQNPFEVPTAYYAGYPYWPLAAVMAAGGLVFGDARWGLLVADAATVAAFIAIARNVGAPGRVGALAGAVLLWNASGLYVTWQSLPEPMVIAFAAIGTAILTRRNANGWLSGVAFGLMVATKQLGLGLLPLLPLSRDRRRQIAFVVAGVVSAAVLLPFLALNPARFLEGSVSSHMIEPARDYAVNLLDPLPGVVARLNVPLVVTGLLALGVGLAARLRWPDSIDGWLAGSAALLTVAFSLIGISFVNYYQIPLALLLILIMVPDGWTADGQSTEPVAPRAA